MRPQLIRRFPLVTIFCVLTAVPAAWSAPVRYVIDPSQSSVHFDARSTAHPFGGDTRDVSGSMVWDAAEQRIGEGAVVRVPVLPILTGEPKRDDAMRKMFEAAIFPDIEFRPDRLVPTGSEDGHYRLEGTLKVRQVQKPVVLDVTVVSSADGSLQVAGATQVRTDEFGLKPPSVLGLIRVLPEVKIGFKSVWMKAVGDL